MSFINTKKITPTLKNAAIRGGATVASAYVANNVLINIRAIPAKAHGPLLFLFGTLLETGKNQTLVTAGQGISAYGALKSAGDLVLPTKKSQLGLAGIEDIQGISGEPVNQFDWSKALQEVSGIEGYDDEVRGMDEIQGPEEMQGMGYMSEYLMN